MIQNKSKGVLKMKTSTARHSKGLGLVIIFVLTLLMANLYAADDFPSRPVTITVGYAPGGSASVSANIFTQLVPKYLPNERGAFIINHKPGATGMLAADYIMKQPADGYNMLWGTQDVVARLALEPNKFKFTLEDFVFVGMFGYSPYALMVNSESTFKTLEELVEHAKKNPSALTYGTSGIGNGTHITGELFQKAADIKLTIVPFAAGTPAVLAMLGGHVTCYLGTPGSLAPHIKAGKARVLIVFDSKRFAGLPDVPCSKEKGYDISGLTHSYQFLALRKGTPRNVVTNVEKVLKQVASESRAKDGLVAMYMEPLYLNSEETKKMLKRDFDSVKAIADQVSAGN
jgi:tripartite-type tricarboxylate transporter receptor subunit TctC